MLWIPCAKTPSGVRSLGVPEVLRAPLLALAAGRRPDERIFLRPDGGPADRAWLERVVRRLCRTAGVPEVRPHSLRGLHSTLAIVNRVPAEVVTRALGHASVSVTLRHYAAPGSTAAGRAAEVAEVLATPPVTENP